MFKNTTLLFQYFLIFYVLLKHRLKKQLSLKGLGFKSELLDNGNILELKLGLSHTVRVKVPSNDVKLEVNNNIINVSGFDAISVGNFVESIRRLKKPDAYKGKGFWLEGESKALKEIKKT
jgi:large subunit ribosomal protein L6